LVNVAGFTAALNSLSKATLFVPSYEALDKAYDIDAALNDSELAEEIVRNHVYAYEAISADSLGELDEFDRGDGTIVVPPDELDEQVVDPNIDCGDQALVHRIHAAFTPKE
jgi:hypothetical protein